MAGVNNMESKVAVTLAFLLMLACNALSLVGAFGSSIASTPKNPTYFSPDGKTFAIWGIIYVLQLVLVVSQWFAPEDAEKLLSTKSPLTGWEARWSLVLAFNLNAMWLPIYSASYYGLSFFVLVAYLGALASAYSVLNTTTVSTPCQWLQYAAPIAANASWAAVALTVNMFIFAGVNRGWKDSYGVAGSVDAAILLVVGFTALAWVMSFTWNDVAWPMVSAWALAGLRRAHTVAGAGAVPEYAMSETLGVAAKWGMNACFGAALLGLLFVACSIPLRPNGPAHAKLPEV